MSYIQGMEEKKIQQPITLSDAEAEAYQAYKREKHILEVMNYMQKTVLDARGEDVKKLALTAIKHGCAAVKIFPSQLALARAAIEGSKLKIDCFIGGTGETFTKAKVYETKLSRRNGAQEITLLLSENDVKNNRFAEIKKEIKKVCKAAKGGCVKVCLKETWDNETLIKLCKISFEAGAKLISVPYFEGCERLRNDLYLGLDIEVTNVQTTAILKKMAGAGMQRIQTARLQSIYDELMLEAENVMIEQVNTEEAISKSQDVQQKSPQKKKVQEYKNLISQK